VQQAHHRDVNWMPYGAFVNLPVECSYGPAVTHTDVVVLAVVVCESVGTAFEEDGIS